MGGAEELACSAEVERENLADPEAEFDEEAVDDGGGDEDEDPGGGFDPAECCVSEAEADVPDSEGDGDGGGGVLPS